MLPSKTILEVKNRKHHALKPRTKPTAAAAAPPRKKAKITSGTEVEFNHQQDPGRFLGYLAHFDSPGACIHCRIARTVSDCTLTTSALACNGWHLRDQRDPPIHWNSTDGRSAHATAHCQTFRSSMSPVAKLISFICRHYGLDRVIITIQVAALAAGCNDFFTKPVSLGWPMNKVIQ
jgi:hypothetical protein